jgi:uncharacterized protein (DUF3820 family)
MNTTSTPLDDNSLMPIGMYKGKPLKEVPDSHLLWIWKTYKRTPNLTLLLAYIQDNLDAIQLNVGREKDNTPKYEY